MYKICVVLLLVLAGCSEPQNLVELEFYEELHNEVERHNKERAAADALAVEWHAAERNAADDGTTNLFNADLTEGTTTSLWGILLQKVGLPAGDFSRPTPNASEPTNPRLGGVGLLGENLYGADPTGADLLYTKKWDQRNSSHPVNLSWWSESSQQESLSGAGEDLSKYPVAAD